MSRWTGKGLDILSEHDNAFSPNPLIGYGLNMLLLKLLIVGTPDEQAYVLAVDEVNRILKRAEHTFGCEIGAAIVR